MCNSSRFNQICCLHFQECSAVIIIFYSDCLNDADCGDHGSCSKYRHRCICTDDFSGRMCKIRPDKCTYLIMSSSIYYIPLLPRVRPFASMCNQSFRDICQVVQLTCLYLLGNDILMSDFRFHKTFALYEGSYVDI